MWHGGGAGGGGGGGGGAKKSWSTKDLDFDANGNLEIKNADLGNALATALTNPNFNIWMIDPFNPSNHINLQCPC